MLLKSWLDSTPMRQTWSRLAATLSLALLAITGACTVTTAMDTTTTSGTGNLLVDWTIASSANAAQCSAYGAQTMSIQVLNSSGQQAGLTTASCSALRATVNGLPVGTYTIQAQLLDANGLALASLPAPVSATISDLTTTTETVDFPAVAFTTPVAGTGTLQVNWTIAEASDATLCATHAAQTLSIQVFNASNVQYGATTNAACSALSASIIDLPQGTYTIQAQMLDANGASVSSLVGPLTETISNGIVTTQALDFPDDSFGAVTTDPTGTGSISVSWTIAEATNTASCGAHDAASISLQLYQADGVTPIGAALLDPCTAFTAILSNLTPGSYALSAQLVNSTMTVSTLIPAQPIIVTANAVATQAFDFPANAF